MDYNEKQVMLSLPDDNRQVYLNGTGEPAFTIAFPKPTGMPDEFKDALSSRLIECFNLSFFEEDPSQSKQETMIAFRNLETAIKKIAEERDALQVIIRKVYEEVEPGQLSPLLHALVEKTINGKVSEDLIPQK